MVTPSAPANSPIEENRRFFFLSSAFRIADSIELGTVTPWADRRAGRLGSPAEPPSLALSCSGS